MQRSLLLCVLVALLVTAAPIAHAQEMEAAVIKVDPVRTEPLAQTAPIIGRLVALQSGVIAARAEGPILEVLVEVGDRVGQGDVLAVLDTEQLVLDRDLRAAQVDAARAALAASESSLKLSRQELARLEKLRKSGSAAFPRARFDDVQEAVVGAQRQVARSHALLNQAQSQLQMSEMYLGRAMIRAPYPGIVTARHVAAGAWLDIGEPVVDMLNDTNLEIEADVPSDRIDGLDPGVPVAVTLDDGTKHTAIVRAVVTNENPLTRTRPVRFTPEIGEVSRALAVNQSLTVYLPVGKPRQIVSVHKDAIVNQQGNSLVYIVEDDAANVRPVQLGVAVGGRFEVLQGLEPGDLVVVRGNERLRPGQKVRIERES
ncbi:MAG: efflux RND transporter periplasmic adaptor subunit [Alphaproteobacteria bacterium]|nr:efflux RND transporter periplasmic adaptor subunit [Alphaproteobacteria bacterium]